MAERFRSRRRPISVVARVTLGASLAVAVVLSLNLLGVVVAVDRMLESEVGVVLAQDIDDLADRVQDSATAPAIVSQVDSRVLLVQITEEGGIIANSDAARSLVPSSSRAVERAEVADDPYLVASRILGDGRTLVVARSLDQAVNAVQATALALGIASVLALGVIGGVIRVVGQRALQPVERLRQQADEIDGQGLVRRLGMSGASDEIDRLATTLNGMLDRIQRLHDAHRRFVSDASHELRSPLATIRYQVELGMQEPPALEPGEVLDVVRVESERMVHLVEDLLLLAKLDETSMVTVCEEVDLDDLVLAEAARLRALPGPDVDISGVIAARINGDGRMMARALRNLVDNAARHARSRVSLSIENVPHAVMVHVDDDGAGVPPSEALSVFERFRRLDEGRARDQGGSGLGLAIVRDVARAHGGETTVTESPTGGARFSVRLPASPVSDDAATASDA